MLYNIYIYSRTIDTDFFYSQYRTKQNKKEQTGWPFCLTDLREKFAVNEKYNSRQRFISVKFVYMYTLIATQNALFQQWLNQNCWSSFTF